LILLPRFLKIRSEAKDIADVAMVMDLRQESFLEKYARIFSRLKDKGYHIEILFLDAADEDLLKRFSETRRIHLFRGAAPSWRGSCGKEKY